MNMLTGVVPAACDAEAGELEAIVVVREDSLQAAPPVAVVHNRSLLQVPAGSIKKRFRTSFTLSPP